MFQNGYYLSELDSFDGTTLKDGLERFVKREMGYKQRFLQSKYSYGFDGYSYMGQTDSSNQYASDMLHSFVLSEFEQKEKFPEEFSSYFDTEWKGMQARIREIERALILKLNIPSLIELYDTHLGHMISCNYYPRTDSIAYHGKSATRLSAHIDVSLLTVFPFGFDNDFYFKDTQGAWKNIAPTKKVVIFPGYLMECITGGAIRGLDHRVSLPIDQSKDRYSFAYFSLPYPGHAFDLNGVRTTSEDYFQSYLDLF